MSLPFILDVAIGLIFIYLILSLLASEIQELLTTLLQWRAKHLKESIEILLSGGAGTNQEGSVQKLVSSLYNDPLIKNINQEAKGKIEQGIRVISRLFPNNRKGAFGDSRSGPSYIAPETFATSLLERLGLATLVNKLVEVRLERFAKRIVGEYSIQNNNVIILSDTDLKDKHNWDKGRIRVIAEKAGKKNLDQDKSFIELVEEYNDILQDFKDRQAILKTCVERMGESLCTYIAAYPVPQPQNGQSLARSSEKTSPNESFTLNDEIASEPAPEGEDLVYFANRLKAFKSSCFGENNERAILSGGLRPSLLEIAELVNETSNTYKEIKESYEAIKTEGKTIKGKVDHEIVRLEESKPNPKLKPNENLDDQLKKLNNDDRHLLINEATESLKLTQGERNLYDNYTTYLAIQEALGELPNSVKESLAILARRAQIKAHQTGNDLDQFREEVAHWFDHSMSRTSGVYKRNAKGIAILIGLLLGAAANADTLHIVNRLSSDQDLRRVVTQQAGNFAPSPGAAPLTREQLEQLRNDTDVVLKNMSLPIGWESANLARQFDCQRTGTTPSTQTTSSTNTLYAGCLGSSTSKSPAFVQLAIARPIHFLKILLGWLISGIAISMGASFWFDLLGKVVNVRNSGGKPRSEASRSSQENNP